MDYLEKNKENVCAFYKLMFNQCKPKKAVELYVGENYIQHNPEVKDGKDGFIDYFERMATEYPEKHVSIKKVFAEGQYVILHCHQMWPNNKEYAGIDIFRLNERGKIVEHWDVLQIIPNNPKNDNSIF